MNFYKIINNDEFIGVGTSYDFRRYQLKHGILLVSDENSAQYIQINDRLYRDDWFAPIITDELEYDNAKIISIDKDEYDVLYKAVETGEEVQIEPIEEPIKIAPIDPNEEVTLEYVKEMKNAEMSACCNKTITNGFDVILNDGNNHHFSLTVQDQLNLITASLIISSGAKTVPYHADNEPFKEYAIEDITMVIDKANEFKTYHTTYYNSLKSYVNNLNDINEINKIKYGVDIPEEYQSDVLKK